MSDVVQDCPLTEEQLSILKVLFNSKPSLRNNLLKHANKELVCTLCECILNILEGNVNVTDKHIKQLKKYKKVLREIGDNKGTWTRKRKLLQKGGSKIIPLIAPILGAFFTHLLK